MVNVSNIPNSVETDLMRFSFQSLRCCLLEIVGLRPELPPWIVFGMQKENIAGICGRLPVCKDVLFLNSPVT